LIATALALSLGLLPVSAWAQAPRHAGVHFGLGLASVGCTFFYGTAKVLYAVLGSATGGLAWLLTGGNGETARSIVQPAVRGDYVVTPENLTSERSLVFVGRDPYRP
jgi:hypothetical protein